NYIAGCSPLLRRTSIACFPASLDHSPFSDWPIYILAAQNGDVRYLREVMGVYRVHPGGLWSGKSREKQLDAVLQTYHEFLEFVDSRNHSTIRDRIFKTSVQLAAERSRIPPGSTILVATQGDPALLYIEGRNTCDINEAAS